MLDSHDEAKKTKPEEAEATAAGPRPFCDTVNRPKSAETLEGGRSFPKCHLEAISISRKGVVIPLGILPGRRHKKVWKGSTGRPRALPVSLSPLRALASGVKT